MTAQKHLFTAKSEDLGIRLDKVLVKHFPERTRQFLQKLLKEGLVLVNSKKAKASIMLEQGQKVEITIPAPKPLDLKARNIPLDIVFENKDLLVINKQAGLVTHPGTGESHSEDSLVNAILHHCKGKLSGIGGIKRPGIVHRLDKDTSGLIVVAKTDNAHQNLSKQLKDHHIEKTYIALLTGHLEPKKGSIQASIGRNPLDRKKMAITNPEKGKAAITNYEVMEYLQEPSAPEENYTLVKIRLITGRTHQIRVHFSSIDYPLVGDEIYGREKINTYFKRKFNLKRQFLHAQKIAFKMPKTNKKVTFETTLPNDLEYVCKKLRTF